MPNHTGFSENEAASLKDRNPLVTPGYTFIESDTQRSKTNKDEVEYSRYNDIPYNDAVLAFDTIADLRAETTPYRKDQLLFVKAVGGAFYHDEADSVSVDNGATILVDSLGRRLKKAGKKAAAQADNATANAPLISATYVQAEVQAITDLSNALKGDLNSLLAKLRASGIMEV